MAHNRKRRVLLSENGKFGFSTKSRVMLIGAAIVVVAAGAGAYIWFGSNLATKSEEHRVTVAHAGEDTLVKAANAAASAETGGLCNRAVIRARSYGVVPPSAASTATKMPTGIEGRFTCQARAETGEAYTLAVDQRCDDLMDHACLAIHWVSDRNGTRLFERRL
jgi:hypothetical protein